MKSLLFFRRATLLALLVAVSLSACKKSNSDPAPDMGARVAGQYNYSELTTGGKTYPASQTNLKGGILVTRESATTVSIELNFQIKSTGETYAEDSASNVTVVETSGGNVEYRYGGNVIAKGSGNKISIEGEGPDGEPLTISATK
ncbi:hypothetical protein [Spirosoma sp. KNUC1025]|uniref:hypothetical protein n=1 Tax=Spirosoma sp. KNUC1025 TaxID=2894082 RepID=UPI00386E006A|nr:hypothetical protein LN737_15265 [Spirosoma sp. KNUC1025]